MQNQRPTIKEVIGAFLFSVQAEGRSPRTHHYYASRLKHFVYFAEEQAWDPHFDELTSFQIRAFLSWIGYRKWPYRAGNTCHRCTKGSPVGAWPYYKSLKRLCAWAIAERIIEINPAQEVHFKYPRPTPVQPYNQQEIARLIAVCDHDMETQHWFSGVRNKAMILMFLDAALRLSEMAGLLLDDISFDQMLVKVSGKGGKNACCPFSATTAKYLRLYLEERTKYATTDGLWISKQGNMLSVEGVATSFASLKVRAGIKGEGRVHRLRHTSALQYLRTAKDSFLLQLFLRHEDLSMSRRYTQALKVDEAIEAHRNGASPVEGFGIT